MRDPYQVLGVSPGASQEEIKRAYRQKAKENHPDLHPDDPRANEKMNEINQAYDQLMHPEKYRGQQQAQAGGDPFGGYRPFRQQGAYGPYGQQGGYDPYQGWSGWFTMDDLFGFGGQRTAGAVPPPQETPFDSQEIRLAVRAINAGQYAEAAGILGRIAANGRDARWHYLFALAQAGMGNTITAQEEIQRAVQLEPGNGLYQQILQQFSMAGQRYQQRSRGFNTAAMNPSRWCMTCLMANLFCNCCCRC